MTEVRRYQTWADQVLSTGERDFTNVGSDHFVVTHINTWAHILAGQAANVSFGAVILWQYDNSLGGTAVDVNALLQINVILQEGDFIRMGVGTGSTLHLYASGFWYVSTFGEE